MWNGIKLTLFTLLLSDAKHSNGLRWIMRLAAWIAAVASALITATPAFAQSAPLKNSTVCAGCHSEIWRSYQQTGMARSFYRPTPANSIEDYDHNDRYHHDASGIDYEMVHVRDTKGDRYVQRQSTVGFDGKRTNVFDNQIDFVMGSGNHARTYLHRTSAGTLEQLPLAWYAERGGYWAMSPGYDRADHQEFQRNVAYDCMFCHNAYPEIPRNSGPRSTPLFTSIPEGIDCQRCHGTGEKHVALAQTGSAIAEIRSAIVNPARLTPERQLDICAQCHLETTSSPLPGSTVRYERGPFSYRPGEPLSAFILHFDHAPGTGHDDKFEISSSVYRLRKSACFRKSAGALTCTTCHNPHQVARGEEAARHYTTVCRQCHGASLDAAVAAGRHTREIDCVSCHMPKRRTDDVVHVVMTDHYIQREPPGNLLAAKAEQPVDLHPYRGEVVRYSLGSSTPQPDDQLYSAIAQVNQQSNLAAGIERLQEVLQTLQPSVPEYYLQLGDALTSAGRPARAIPAYERALAQDPNSVPGLERFALCLSSLRQYSRAESILKVAIKVNPQSARTWVLLGGVRVQEGQLQTAMAAFDKAMGLDDRLPDSFATAGAIAFEMGDASRGEQLLRRAILLQPNDPAAHNNLGNLLSAAGRFEEARFHFESALHIRPNYNGARYNYALALVKAHHPDEAQSQLESLLRTDPNSAAGHEFLGNILRSRGHLDDAIKQYREAIRIVPDFAQANLELGAVLADAGELSGALECFRKAARSTDASIRDEALKRIEQIGPRR